MTEKITKKAIDALKARAQNEKKTCYIFDSEVRGFAALATKTGTCNYFIEYRLRGAGGSPKRVTLGRHGALTPDEARRRAQAELGKVANGKDIAQARKDERAKLKAGTFRDLAESYFAANGRQDKTGEWKSRHWKETHTMMEKLVYPTLGGKAPDAITKADISGLINKTKANSHSVARRLHETLRPLFGWAFSDCGAIQSNPMAGVKGPKPVEARDRVLSDEEVRALWQAASQENWPFSSVFKVLLLTGQRRNEVSGMRWREVDLDASAWTIAKERAKNGKAHTVDLHPEAVRLLDPLGDAAAPRLMKDTEGKADLVYSTTGRTPVSGFSKVKARIDDRMREILGDAFQPWRIHDLRRTAASGMAALGFQPHVIERVLNHVSGAQGGLVSVYQRHDYREERKRAIMGWGDKVMQLATGEEKAASNVVPLRVA
jgi:integrase